jgi:hypothetical protein
VVEISADLALAGLRIVRRADPGKQQKLHVEKLKRAQQHHVRRLFPLFARRIHIGDASRSFA